MVLMSRSFEGVRQALSEPLLSVIGELSHILVRVFWSER